MQEDAPLVAGSSVLLVTEHVGVDKCRRQDSDPCSTAAAQGRKMRWTPAAGARHMGQGMWRARTSSAQRTQ